MEQPADHNAVQRRYACCLYLSDPEPYKWAIDSYLSRLVIGISEEESAKATGAKGLETNDPNGSQN